MRASRPQAQASLCMVAGSGESGPDEHPQPLTLHPLIDEVHAPSSLQIQLFLGPLFLARMELGLFDEPTLVSGTK